MKTVGIAARVYFAVAILAVVALVVGLQGVAILSSYQNVVDDMESASNRAVLGGGSSVEIHGHLCSPYESA
ncbi:MAG: hypothetical protein WCF85_00695, partial [Rhodospirillaceae bacterium]